MHFDQRTQQALRDAGVAQATIEAAADNAVTAAREDADAIESFFEGRETAYSDMDRAHSASETQEHTVEYCDLYTHAADIRGYVRFDTWGVPVEAGRVLDEDVVELTLGGTVDGRVRFAADAEAL